MQTSSRTKNYKRHRIEAGSALATGPQRVQSPAQRIDGSQGSSECMPMRLMASCQSTLSSTDQFLLQHYFYTVSGLLSSTPDRSINTYCRVILPMAMSCDLLLNTLLLVSTSHLASRYEQFELDLPHYRNRVLPDLIDRINKWDSFDATTLATIIMMSINEVSNELPCRWSLLLEEESRLSPGRCRCQHALTWVEDCQKASLA